MRQLTLLAIPDCPLSAHARHVLDTLAADGLLAWHEAATGTPNSETLQRNAPELLPALFNESGLLLALALAHGRLSERGLRRALATPAEAASCSPRLPFRPGRHVAHSRNPGDR